ncbi:MAG: NAD(P)/FAD-dependent oxidoreductase [Nanohaloarchaea archaeon]|nr:NAD(P)/FAD-dependent oxidoreductase [Candidatus Nanohaloarchaea archaeon]
MRTVTVVGGGIAGLQTAVFTAKAGEDTLVLDTGESLVHNTSNIKNLIGHESVSGQELLNSGKQKLEDFGGELKEEKVESVERSKDGFVVKTAEEEYESEYVVVASAGSLEFLDVDVEFEKGVEGPYMMEKHVKTDDSNKAAEKLYAAGLANSWEYQTSTAIGDGSKAAVNLLSDLYGEPYTDHDT